MSEAERTIQLRLGQLTRSGVGRARKMQPVHAALRLETHNVYRKNSTRYHHFELSQ